MCYSCCSRKVLHFFLQEQGILKTFLSICRVASSRFDKNSFVWKSHFFLLNGLLNFTSFLHLAILEGKDPWTDSRVIDMRIQTGATSTFFSFHILIPRAAQFPPISLQKTSAIPLQLLLKDCLDGKSFLARTQAKLSSVEDFFRFLSFHLQYFQGGKRERRVQCE